jgi:hypothetical protein
LDEVKYDKLFHGGQSKVWLTSTAYTNEISNEVLSKDVLVFYANGTVCLTDFSKLYQGQGKKGTYMIYSENKELDIRFGEERWFFTFEVKDEHHIILQPNEGSTSNNALRLTTIPEFNP